MIALVTLAYTVGTFSVWRETRKSYDAMRDAFKLNFIMALHAKQQPGGNPLSIEEQNWYRDKRRLEALLQRAFPEIFEELAGKPSTEQ